MAQGSPRTPPSSPGSHGELFHIDHGKNRGALPINFPPEELRIELG